MLANRAEQGFTLLEMLAVILLMAIGMSLLTVAVNRGLSNARDRQAGRELALALRTARTEAVLHNAPAVVQFDLANNTYQAPGKAPHSLPEGMHMRLTTAAGLVPDKAVIAFYPEGNSSGGNIYLSKGERAWRVDVAWLTGIATWREMATP